jgi:hypothetical protein
MARNLDRFVRRYTTMSSAIDTLENRRLVLLSPKKWDDTNDSDFMELYRRHAKVNSLLALCCTMASETYHHWRVFTQGMEGVCIEFDKLSLERSLSQDDAIIMRPVDYLLVRDLEALGNRDACRLAFVKRDGYSDEREWRIVLGSQDKDAVTKDIPIELNSISRIIINPWLPPSLANSIKLTIRRISGCADLKIESSALTNSARWKKAGQRLLNGS